MDAARHSLNDKQDENKAGRMLIFTHYVSACFLLQGSHFHLALEYTACLIYIYSDLLSFKHP